MQQERRLYGLWSVAKPALAGLLVVLLLLPAILAASPSHKKSSHAGSSDDKHLCIVCLFARGQVDLTDVAPLRAVLVSDGLGFVVLVEAAVLTEIDLRLSPDRGPPFDCPSHPVVG
jgi:hypothetical protein